MKNIQKSLIKGFLGLGLAITSVATMAATMVNAHPGYFSTQESISSGAGTAHAVANGSYIELTDITVRNVSADSVRVIVPNTPVDRRADSGKAVYVQNNRGAYRTTIVLEDSRNNVFLPDVEVCPRAMLTVTGRRDDFKVIVDNHYCN